MAGLAAVVTVDPGHQLCTKAADCTKVGTDCGGCDSCGQPVRWLYKKQYTDQIEKLCANDQGPQCDAAACDKTLVCTKGKCVYEPKVKAKTKGKGKG